MTTAQIIEFRAAAQFNPIFRPVNEWRGRYRILKGSAGSGKSVNIAQDYIAKLSDPTFQGANLLVVRKIEETNRDSTFAELQAAIYRMFGPHADRFWKVNLSPLALECRFTGNRIIFRGMKDQQQREKVKSITFKNGKLVWIWCEEATELLSEDIDILDDRLRGNLDDLNPNLYYQITMTFNPVSATHWIKARYFDKADPDVLTHHSTYRTNRFIDTAYSRRMERRKQVDPEGYIIYGLGEWGEIGGLILHNWEVKEVSRNLNDYDDIAIGQDFGFNHANAILLLGWKDGNVSILDEIYLHEKDTAEIITEAIRKEIPRNKQMWCDSAEPDRIKMWKDAGFRARGVDKGGSSGSVKAQIDWLKQRTIYIHPHCINTIKEMQQWKWKKDERSGEYLDDPVPIMDDAMAALRYGVEGWRKVKKWII